jgi:hypothetical protein
MVELSRTIFILDRFRDRKAKLGKPRKEVLMSEENLAKITGLLQSWQQGNRDALEELWPLVTLPLARISRNLLREFVSGENRGATMSTTDLVHQAFPKLAKYASRDDRPWQNRVEFYALAKKVMLCVLLDYKRYAERHGNHSGEQLSGDEAWSPNLNDLSIDDLLDLEKCLELLHTVDPDGHRVIQLRFFEDRTMNGIIEETGWTEYKAYLYLKGALGFLYAKMRG